MQILLYWKNLKNCIFLFIFLFLKLELFVLKRFILCTNCNHFNPLKNCTQYAELGILSFSYLLLILLFFSFLSFIKYSLTKKRSRYTIFCHIKHFFSNRINRCMIPSIFICFWNFRKRSCLASNYFYFMLMRWNT